MAKWICWIGMELLHYRRQIFYLIQIKNLVRSGRYDHIVIAMHLRGKLRLVEKRHRMPAIFKTGGKISDRDIRPTVVGECILVDGDVHTLFLAKKIFIDPSHFSIPVSNLSFISPGRLQP
jgi:hypothetical protein